MKDWPITAQGTENYISVLKTASTRLKKKKNNTKHTQKTNHKPKKTKYKPPQNFIQTLEA